MTRSLIPLLAIIAGCNSKQVVEDAQCSDEEQGMFMACLSSGCSASYEQDLSGKDSCSVEGGGTVVSVEAGGECGFTSSGSCYVLCDCPDGVGVEFNTADREPQESPSEYEGDMAGECSDRADNDRDGLYDCADPDCAGSPDCAEGADTGNLPEDPDTGDTGGEDLAVDADGDGYAVEDGDCNDRNPAVNPAASDIVGDLIDQNCDGIDGTDMDRDGFASEASGGSDCDDFDATVNPDYGIRDVTDYVDSNCDGEDGLSYDYKALLLENMGIAGKGDFDGDGISDAVVYTFSSESSGWFIIFGSTLTSALSNRITVSDADVAFHLVTEIGWDFTVGDIDADGKDDIVWNYNNRAYLWLGSTISVQSNLIAGSNEDAQFYSGNTYNPYASAEIVPDLTGDGVADVVSFYSVSSGYAGEGRVYYPTVAGSINVATTVSGSPLWTLWSSLTVLGFDSNGNGKPEFRSRCYASSGGYWREGYRDMTDTDCNGYLNTFRPTMVLPDIDGDGDKELSDGYCVQNSSNFSDSSYCEYSFTGSVTAEQFLDVDGDGLMDFGESSGRVLTLDITGTASEQIALNTPANWNVTGDYNGDGVVDLVVGWSDGTNIVGIR